MGSVNGKVALITGGARGIGAGVARRLHGKGAKLVLIDVDEAPLKELAAELGEDNVMTAIADVRDLSAMQHAVDNAAERFSGIDIVVANAGIVSYGSVLQVDPEAFKRVIDVNVVGVFNTVRAALPAVIDRRGYVLVVSSLAAYAAVSREAPTWRLALAWALAETDRRDAARTELELIADNQFSCVVRDVSWPSAMSLAARLCYTLGDAGNADVVHSLLSPFAALHVISAHAAYSGPVEHHLGLTAMVVGHLTDAIEHFEKALAVEESIGAKAWTAHTGAAMSAALAGRGRAGDASAARALRGACLATAKQLGMTRLQEQLMDG